MKDAHSRILISINTAWNIVNFRAGLIRALIDTGYEVVAFAPPDEHVVRLAGMGCRFVALPMDNKGANPLRDLALFFRYIHLFRRERPAGFLGYTIKPNIYGSLAARFCGVPVINNVSGLGTAFIRDSWITRVVKQLYRAAFRRSRCVFFQNEDDLKLFLDLGLVRAEQTRLLPGSGIDLEYFVPDTESSIAPPDAPVFTLIARLIFDKGVREYAEAARQVRARYPGTRFQLLGFLDVENRTAVTRKTVEAWVADGAIDYLGTVDDVRPIIAGSDCVVLPSYREGTPRTLLEAAAMGKPLIATDVPGCRNVVTHGENGFLCDARSGDDLAQKMIDFIALSPAARAAMGRKSRELAESRFDEKIVVDAYLEAIKEISL